MWNPLRRKEKNPDLSQEMEDYFKTEAGKAELRAYFKTPEGAEEFHAATQTPEGAEEFRVAVVQEALENAPTLMEALPLDAATYESFMMKPLEIKSGMELARQVVRTAWESDAFLCLLLYRVRTRLILRKVPVLPMVLHRLCMMIAQIDIGDKVVLQPGVYIAHGQVVIDGAVEIGTGTSIAPWVSIGLDGREMKGPRIGKLVFIGTGAKILGDMTVGDGARIAANSVVMKNVAPNTTVAGAPARLVRDRE